MPHKPFDSSYWVVPGRLLAGFHPGDPDPREAERKLGALLDCGILTLIDLTEADECDLPGRSFGNYAPLLERLARERGIAASHLRLPIEDGGVPSAERLERILEAIEGALARGRSVYLHCWGGRGRTGLVAACYLIAHGRATGDDFARVLAGLRGPKAVPGESPQTGEQRAFVRDWTRAGASRPSRAPGSRRSGLDLLSVPRPQPEVPHVSERIFNFAPGPAVLPEEVLEQLARDVWEIDGSGIGILEHSHRGPVVDRVFAEAEADCRKLAALPDEYRVLFLQGGASTQFLMLPANFLPAEGTADYLLTGSWSARAVAEAERYGRVHLAASSAESRFSYVPGPHETRYSQAPAYVHFTSNNTIAGTQFSEPPTPPVGSWLACDASSDIFSRPLDVSGYGLLYAGAQKNLGPAGVTLAIIREDLLEGAVRDLPPMLRYATHAGADSRYNTPPVLQVYVVGRVLRWLLDRGGLEAVGEANRAKAALVYEVLDRSDFYRGAARRDSRSDMNITFRLPSEELEAEFLAEAEGERMSGLKGHRSVGGVRASIYNAFPRAGCEALAAFMREFERRRG